MGKARPSEAYGWKSAAAMGGDGVEERERERGGTSSPERRLEREMSQRLGGRRRRLACVRQLGMSVVLACASAAEPQIIPRPRGWLILWSFFKKYYY